LKLKKEAVKLNANITATEVEYNICTELHYAVHFVRELLHFDKKKQL